jgi:hypothetical protein
MSAAATGIDQGSLVSKANQVNRGIFYRRVFGAAHLPEVFHDFHPMTPFLS